MSEPCVSFQFLSLFHIGVEDSGSVSLIHKNVALKTLPTSVLITCKLLKSYVKQSWPQFASHILSLWLSFHNSQTLDNDLCHAKKWTGKPFVF